MDNYNEKMKYTMQGRCDKKNIGISYCRVAATISIVVCHIIKYYTMIPFSQHMPQFFNVGVEMFIILSGYLYGEKKISDYKKFYMDRYLKICLPVQIWTVVMLVCTYRREITPYFKYFLNISGIGWIHSSLSFPAAIGELGHTWFVTIILLCYTLIPIMQKVCGKWARKKVFLGLMLIWSITIVLSLYEIQIYYFVLFLSAYYRSYYNIEIKNIFEKGYFLFTILTVLLSAGRLFLRLNEKYALFYDGIYVPISKSLLAVWIIITICILCRKQKKLAESISRTGLFRWLETLSYPIYIIHYCLIARIYGRYGIWMASIVFLVLMASIATIFYMCNKMITNGIYKFINVYKEKHSI